MPRSGPDQARCRPRSTPRSGRLGPAVALQRHGRRRRPTARSTPPPPTPPPLSPVAVDHRRPTTSPRTCAFRSRLRCQGAAPRPDVPLHREATTPPEGRVGAPLAENAACHDRHSPHPGRRERKKRRSRRLWHRTGFARRRSPATAERRGGGRGRAGGARVGVSVARAGATRDTELGFLSFVWPSNLVRP